VKRARKQKKTVKEREREKSAISTLTNVSFLRAPVRAR